MAPFYLDCVRATPDGYLCILSSEEEDTPQLLYKSEKLWKLLHPHNSEFSPSFQTETPPLELLELRPEPTLFDLSCQTLQDMMTLKEKQRIEKKEKSVGRPSASNTRVSMLKRQQAARSREFEHHPSAPSKEDFADATLRTVRTLNSMRAIFPLLLSMIHHERRQDEELEINADNGKLYSLATKKAPKSQRWLFGDYVFDIRKVQNINKLEQHMLEIFRCFMPEAKLKDMKEAVWSEILEDIVRKEQLEYTQEQSSFPLPQEILTVSGLSGEESQTRIQATAQKYDDQCLSFLLPKHPNAQRDRERYQQCTKNLIEILNTLIGKRIRNCTLSVYGSCLSDLSLGKSSDVDISLMLPKISHAEERVVNGDLDATGYEKIVKRSCYDIFGILKSAQRQGFHDIECVPFARVPVVKGTFMHAGNPFTPDGSLHFDICFMNDIAVANSSLLSQYAAVHEKVKHFLLAVKAWARDSKVNSAANNRISSYAWTNMAIFYLQIIGMVPNLQCEELMKQHGFQPDPRGNPEEHFVNALHTAYLQWEIVRDSDVWKPRKDLNTMPVSLLLYGFFHFYTRAFSISLMAVSIRRGRSVLPKAAFPKANLVHICIEDPFELYDSHCPHDLGHPADTAGHRHIRKLLAMAERHLGTLLVGGTEVGSLRHLWMIPNAAEQKVAPQQERKEKPRRRKKKKKKEGAGKANATKLNGAVETDESKKESKSNKSAEKNLPHEGSRTRRRNQNRKPRPRQAKEHTHAHNESKPAAVEPAR